MRPPAVVQVGPHPLTIRIDVDAAYELIERRLAGEHDAFSGRILLDHRQTPSQQRDTLVHELLHALLDLTGLAGYPEAPLDDGQEERLIRALAPALLDLLARNPMLVAYLIEGEP